MKIRFSPRYSVITALSIFSLAINAQNSTNTGACGTTNKYYNWFNLDAANNKIVGISTDRSYDELLKGKTLSRVIVAVIDGGVDIKHEDLQGKIWVNPGEIPGNGIDDDKNGYVDDVNGWNFIGGVDGKNINQETEELTRLYKKYKEKFKGIEKSSLTRTDLTEYAEFQKIKEKYEKKTKNTFETFQNIQNFYNNFVFCDSLLQALFQKTDYTIKDVKSLKTKDNEQLAAIKEFMLYFFKRKVTPKELKDYYEYFSTRVKYNFNPDFDPRGIVGDDPETNNNRFYGNNDVSGPKPDHGTFVSGIIAANRHNNIGIQGIADSVKIMVVRAVPNGDERDKDVANAIIYAVNNGAQILNLSFGKDFSPQKKFVDEALKYAASKNVLIVHASGNDAKNIDSLANFPTNQDSLGNPIMKNWITVGASSQKKNKELAGNFSNYGQKEVDLFAPGVRIYGAKPNNKYEEGDGTSFASPMVAGAAALVWSAYPKLTASQVKEILLKSSVKYPRLKVYLPTEEGKKKKVRFDTLSQTGGVLNVYEALKLAEQYNN
jgi:subtilisin family serine protease